MLYIQRRKSGNFRSCVAKKFKVADLPEAGFNLGAPAWWDQTSYFISFGVRLGSETLGSLQRWQK